MSSARITYTTQLEVPTEGELGALSAIYRCAIERYEETKAAGSAHPDGRDDATKGFRLSENEKGGRHVEH